MQESRLRSTGCCSLGLLVLAVVVFTGCAPAVLSIDAEPRDALVSIDGEPRGTGSIRVPSPYYGTCRVEVVPRETEDLSDLEAVSRMVALEPPAPLWLFPFDLLVELAGHPWRERDNRVELRAEPREVPQPGERPATEELRERAWRALTLR